MLSTSRYTEYREGVTPLVVMFQWNGAKYDVFDHRPLCTNPILPATATMGLYQEKVPQRGVRLPDISNICPFKKIDAFLDI